MSVFKKANYALRSLFSKRKVENDLDEEIQFHIEMETQKNLASGMPPNEAKRLAKVAFGGVEHTKEICRDSFGARILADAFSDCSYAFRFLGKRKGFSLSVLITLGICIGANSTFFAALNSLVLTPMPFAQSDQLVEIYRSDLNSGNQKLGNSLSLLNEYAEQKDIFQSVAYFSYKWMNLEIKGQTSRVKTIPVSNDFFKTLRSRPVRGTLIDHESDDKSAVLSHRLWEQLQQNSEEVVGTTIVLNGDPFTVIGVASPEADKVENWAGIFTKINQTNQSIDSLDEELRAANEGTIWARLKIGVTENQVQSSLEFLENRFLSNANSWYQENNDIRLRPITVSKVKVEHTKWARSRLYLLNGTALLVLAIGCVNVSNLLLAHSNARSHEFWIRHTIGAQTNRLVRQCITEISLLSFAGWICSLAVCAFGVRLLDAYSSELFELDEGVSFGLEAIAYSLITTICCCLIIGLIVAWKSLGGLKGSGGNLSVTRATSDQSATRLREFLSIGQTALTLALLIGVGLLVKSFYQVVTQDVGFSGDSVTTARVHLPELTYPDPEQREQFKDRLLEKLRSTAGIESVAISSMIPTYGYPDNIVTRHGANNQEGSGINRAYFTYVTPGYLDTMGVTLMEGRDFEESDESGWQDPLLVDERFARIHFPGKSAIGERINLGGAPRNPNNWPEIVGVVETAKHTSIDGSDFSLPLVYRPLKSSWVREFSVFVNSTRSTSDVLKELNEAVASIDPSVPLFRFGNLNTIVDETLRSRKGLLLLSLAMGSIALALAAIGMYGSAAFRISQKLREFAIRMAIGATETTLVQASVKRDLQLATFGLGIGLFIAFASARFMASWLYNVAPFDWQVSASLTLIVFATCATSSYLPARREIGEGKVRL